MSHINKNVQGQTARPLRVHALAAAKYQPMAFLRQLSSHDPASERGKRTVLDGEPGQRRSGTRVTSEPPASAGGGRPLRPY